ncbi:PREDICTED: carboxypeptidase B-like [Priapulus caudatus]|uniref:Carboxypeptidase B-like n=1 Tax=Priapulus caudatus TaxID=37621 RepID=A0ABM1EEH0_PRICU|nr:PREDICTED: carboxypeptidase B-like [Priapulus caudatus]
MSRSDDTDAVGPHRHRAEDYDDMKSVAERASDAMVTLSDTPYNNYFEVGVSSDMLYAATGTSTDWVKGVLGVKYAYTMELRDMGRYGFFLPSREILKSGEEIWLAVKSYADAILKEEE